MDAEHPTIKAAVEAVKEREDARVAITVPAMQQAHAWTEDAEITLTAPSDPHHPSLMVWQPEKSAWRIVMLPPGSTLTFTITPASPIWTPEKAVS